MVATPPAAARALRALTRRPKAAPELAPVAVAAGATTKEIAEVLGIDPRTVARRYGCAGRRGSRDRHDVTDQDVLDLAELNLSQREIADHLTEELGRPVSRGLVRRRLARHNLATPFAH
jgi:FixJ family two-component response regulator